MKRTAENCTIADKVYDSREDPSRYIDGKCAGVRDYNDNLISKCEDCKLNYYYEDDEYE